MKNPTSRYHIINLHHVDSARPLPGSGPIYGISSVHPRHLLGHLWDEDSYEGAWMENFRIIAQLRDKVHIFEAPGIVPCDPSELAGWVLRALLAGKSPHQIQDALDRSQAKTWAMIP